MNLRWLAILLFSGITSAEVPLVDKTNEIVHQLGIEYRSPYLSKLSSHLLEDSRYKEATLKGLWVQAQDRARELIDEEIVQAIGNSKTSIEELAAFNYILEKRETQDTAASPLKRKWWNPKTWAKQKEKLSPTRKRFRDQLRGKLWEDPLAFGRVPPAEFDAIYQPVEIKSALKKMSPAERMRFFSKTYPKTSFTTATVNERLYESFSECFAAMPNDPVGKIEDIREALRTYHSNMPWEMQHQLSLALQELRKIDTKRTRHLLSGLEPELRKIPLQKRLWLRTGGFPDALSYFYDSHVTIPELLQSPEELEIAQWYLEELVLNPANLYYNLFDGYLSRVIHEKDFPKLFANEIEFRQFAKEALRQIAHLEQSGVRDLKLTKTLARFYLQAFNFDEEADTASLIGQRLLDHLRKEKEFFPDHAGEYKAMEFKIQQAMEGKLNARAKAVDLELPAEETLHRSAIPPGIDCDVSSFLKTYIAN